MRKFTTLLAMLVFTGWAGTASANLMTAIGALAPGAQYRVIYTTTSQTDATLPNLDFYDAIVQADADIGSVTGALGLSWKAVGSTYDTTANVHTETLPGTGPPTITIFNTLGETVANSYVDLWDGSLSAGVGYDRNGLPLSTNVWTGTGRNGSFFLPFGGAPVVFGNSDELSPMWVEAGATDPTIFLSLYGISSIGTVAAVPIPAAGFLFITALVGLFGAKRIAPKQQVC